MSRQEEVDSLARMFHDSYERIAKEVGWKTQESCKVEFDDLPEENKQVMLRTVGEVVDNGIGTKDRFEIDFTKTPNPPYFVNGTWCKIQPIDYGETNG